MFYRAPSSPAAILILFVTPCFPYIIPTFHDFNVNLEVSLPFHTDFMTTVFPYLKL